jgi:hypothetical protein
MATTIKITTYPDFDAKLREHQDAVRDADTQLEQLFAKISGPKGDKIRAAIKKMSDAREKSQELSDNVNSNYKKLKDEHDKVIKKAKQLKHINEGLLKRIQESGVAVSTPAQAQKRTAEEADITKPQPQKRQRDESVGEGAVYYERREAPRIPRFVEWETTPKPPTPPKSTGNPSPARKKTAPPAHTTSVPKVKPSNFSKSIPFGTEHKFAATRLSRPNPLLDPTKTSSHVTAVFQGIAATVKAHKAFGGLDQHAKTKRQFKMRRDDFNMKDIDDELQGMKTIPASKAFVDTVASMQQPQSRAVNTYPLQCKFEQQDPKGVRTATDPVRYMEHVLKATQSSYIKEAYDTPNAYQHFCPNCDGMHACADTQDRAKFHTKEHQAPTIETEYAYITPLAPTFTPRELKYGGAAARDLSTLLKEKSQNPTMLRYPRCNHAYKTTTSLQKHWLGFAYAPEVLTLGFDRRPNDKKYKLTLPLETNLKPYIRDSGAYRTGYRLVTVIKKLTYGGSYISFVHTEDGKWWRCMEDTVKEVPIEYWQGDVKNGETVMALYERLDG